MGIFCGLFLNFVIYSFLGWLCETTYCSIPEKKFINRGFLNGPFCPIYGFGALLIIFLLENLSRNAVIVFLAGTAITTALEYFTGFLLEVVFHAKWWDYSQNKFNFKGRICLANSIMFGLLSVALVYFIQPLAGLTVSLIPLTAKIWLTAGFFAYFAADISVTVGSMHNLNVRIESIGATLSAVKDKLDNSEFYNALNVKERLEKLHEILDTENGRAIYDSLENFRERIKQLELDNKIFQNRLIKAFPHLRSTRYPDVLNSIKEKILSRKRGSEKAADSAKEKKILISK